MERLFADAMPYVTIYIDDITVHSKTWAEHLIHLTEAITKLTDAGFRINFDKTHLGRREIRLLGFIKSKDGIRLDHTRLKHIAGLARPMNGGEDLAIMGMFNHLRDHIPMYAHVAAPLESLRSSKQITDEQWNNNPAYQIAFDSMKQLLANAPMLSTPDFNKEFYIATDASNFGLGCVLFQTEHPGVANHPDTKYIQFFARSLKPSERFYSATKRELTAVVFALAKCHPYIWGKHFTIFTDHNSLTYMMHQEKPSVLMNTYLTTLMEYDFTIIHRPGIQNILPDALSRIAQDFDSRLPFARALNEADKEIAMYYTGIDQGAETQEQEFYDHEQEGDPFYISLPDEQTEEDVPIVTRDQLHTVTKDYTDNEKEQHLKNEHELGHFGARTIVKGLWTKGIQWNNINADALKLVAQCTECQRWNIKKTGFHPLQPIHASLPMDHIAMDLLSQRTSRKGYNFVLVVVDIATRFVFLRALMDKEMDTIVKKLIRIFADTGFPKIIQADNGTEFANKLVQQLVSMAKADMRFTTPYHPRANGAAEAHVKTTKQVLQKYLGGKQDNWEDEIPKVQYAMNVRTVSFHNSTPFSLFYCRSPNQFKDFSKIPIADKIIDPRRIDYMNDLVFPTINEVTTGHQQRMKEQFGKRFKNVVIDEFPIGATVMVKPDFRKNKQEARFEGPYRIMRKTRGNTYELMDTDQKLLGRNYAPQQLAIISRDMKPSELTYEINKILDHRVRNNQDEYLVSWKGYDEETWVPYKDFQDVEIIRKYHDKHRKEFLQQQRKTQPQVRSSSAEQPLPKKHKSK